MGQQNDVGIIGLGVMGSNYALNIIDKGFSLSAFDIDSNLIQSFQGKLNGKAASLYADLKDFVKSIKPPRKVVLLIKAGAPVDAIIAQLKPHLDKEDIIVDLGNSNYTDTMRRYNDLNKDGLYFVGAGISGGEEGARNGPSIMPGGNEKAWKQIKDILQSTAAQVGNNEACCDWVGPSGAGHYVKMVHNGIEYGDMQLICEIWHVLSTVLSLEPDDCGDIFERWNQGVLESYLVDITSKILKKKDDDGAPLIDKILDVAGQKGTGKWTVVSSMEQGSPLNLVGEAVYARFLSTFKDMRQKASSLYTVNLPNFHIQEADKHDFILSCEQALYAAKIISYAQGYSLLREAAENYNWTLNFAGIARMWRGGCIIRSRFLRDIENAFKCEPQLENLLFDGFFQTELTHSIPHLRRLCALALEFGIPVPGLCAAISYFDSLRTAVLPANLLQAQRDFFGSHTYERRDKPRGQFFHTDWNP